MIDWLESVQKPFDYAQGEKLLPALRFHAHGFAVGDDRDPAAAVCPQQGIAVECIEHFLRGQTVRVASGTRSAPSTAD